MDRMLKYKYKSYGMSDIGTVKKVNQDSFYRQNGKYNGDYLLFAMVADGMGGLDAGEIASKMITDNFNTWFHKKGLEAILLGDYLQFEQLLQESIADVVALSNEQINAYGKENNMIIGSTATMILFFRGTYYAANIGDSRIYRLSDNNLYQITVDHSWMQQQLDLGYSEEEILDDPAYDDLCNRITRCVGAGMDCVYADYFANDYKAGDMFLICSDGLIHTNSVDEIVGILQNEELTLQDKTQTLIDMAKERGEEDNITAILVEVFDDIEKDASKTAALPSKESAAQETEKVEKSPNRSSEERITQVLD